MKFKTELKLKGINLSEKEIEDLKEIALNEAKMDMALDLENKAKEGRYSSLILAAGLSEAYHELLLGVSQLTMAGEFKRRFNALKNRISSINKQFDKDFKKEPQLLKAKDMIASEFTELIYQYLDRVNQS